MNKSKARKQVIISIDDDKDMLALMEQWLTNAGYEVFTVNRPSDVFPLLEKVRPDLILLDVLMSEMNGYKLCEELQSRPDLASIPVVFLTSLDTQEARRKAITMGGLESLAKPLSQEKLLKTVEIYLNAAKYWKDKRRLPSAPPEKSRDAPGKAPLDAKPEAGGAAKPPNILVVEDDTDSQELMRLILEKRGCQVTLAADGNEALDRLRQGRFDLVLADVNMPNLNGFQLWELVIKKRIRTPVLFITACSNNEMESKGYVLGSADYISKPIKNDALITRIENVLSKASRASASQRRRGKK